MEKKTYKKILATVMALFTSGLGFLILLQLINVIDIRMLKSGYLEGSGALQFVKVYAGIPLFLLAAIGWLSLVIFSFNYFSKGVDKGNLLQRFSLVTAIELYFFPFIVLVYHIAFPISMVSIDWVIVVIGLLLGSLSLYYFLKNRTTA